jgi:ribonuclease HI
MNKLFINCDGGSRGNPGPSACAFIVKDLDGNLVYREGNFLGIATTIKPNTLLFSLL